MATTSPDNLFSPNPTDNYNLIADWATSMQSVQAALVKRANMYVGTSTQRTAFTTAPEGVHWQDTNGTKLEYVRQSSAWVPVGGVSVAWTSVPLKSGFTGSVRYRKKGDVVEFRFDVTGNVSSDVEVSNALPSDLMPSSEGTGLTIIPTYFDPTSSRPTASAYVGGAGTLRITGSGITRSRGSGTWLV